MRDSTAAVSQWLAPTERAPDQGNRLASEAPGACHSSPYHHLEVVSSITVGFLWRRKTKVKLPPRIRTHCTSNNFNGRRSLPSTRRMVRRRISQRQTASLALGLAPPILPTSRTQARVGNLSSLRQVPHKAQRQLSSNMNSSEPSKSAVEARNASNFSSRDNTTRTSTGCSSSASTSRRPTPCSRRVVPLRRSMRSTLWAQQAPTNRKQISDWSRCN